MVIGMSELPNVIRITTRFTNNVRYFVTRNIQIRVLYLCLIE